MTRKQRRMTMIGAAGVVLFAAVGLILFALQDQIVFFNSPSDIAANSVKPGQRIRLGGLVKEETVIRGEGTKITFVVTDGGADVEVNYNGILPDLFREGQGVVTEGAMTAAGIFVADTVLAKHDETYMPKEVADALKKQGHWQGDGPDPKTTKINQSVGIRANPNRQSADLVELPTGWNQISSNKDI